MEENPTLLQLRALQTMETTKGNTLVLGVGAGDVVVKKSEYSLIDRIWATLRRGPFLGRRA
jgi:hypothetical protein